MIYLDNAATTQVCPEAAEAAVRLMTENFGNPSSTHALGRKARDELKNARAIISSSLGAQPEEIYFTAGGTEGDNWAIRSGCHLMRHKGRHIISSAAEHDAVRKSLAAMEDQSYEVTLLSPGRDGAIHAEDVVSALRPDTVLVSLMLVNNETGAITDIPAIAKALKAHHSQALLHTDAVQAYMKLPFTVRRLGADMITLSAHKLHAPKGTGALYVRKGIQLPGLLVGGGQESGRRAGTEGLPGICAFAAAVKAIKEDHTYHQRLKALRTQTIDLLSEFVPEAIIIGDGAPHILCVSLPGYRSEVLLNYLDKYGICISKGSACKKGARSHVLEAMGLSASVIDGAIRVSFGRFTTKENITEFTRVLKEARDTLAHL